jgi:hypothetical protein
MASEDRANDADRGDLEERVSTFGESLEDLDDDELARQAESYLSDIESAYQERADDYLGFSESWGKNGD